MENSSKTRQIRRALFTDLGIQKLAFTPKPTYVWDTATPLGLRTGKRTKTFVAYRPDGLRVSIGKYPYCSLSEARQRVFKLYSARYDEDGQKAPQKPAHELVEEYLRQAGARLRHTTVDETKRILIKYTPDKDITKITTQDILAITDEYLDKPSRAVKIHSKFTAFFNWCVKRRYLKSSPLQGVGAPAKNTSRDRVLSDDELKLILRTAWRLRTPYAMFIMVLIMTGLRRTEAATLHSDNVTKTTITIPKEIAKNGIELVLPNIARPYLPDKKGKLWPFFDFAIEKAAFDKECGVTNWVHHDLRRTLSTKMAEWEITTPDVVEAILNHVTGTRSKVQRIYDRHNRFPQMQKALVAYRLRLEKWIDEA